MPAPSPGGRARLPWILGGVAVVACLVLVAASLAVMRRGPDRTAAAGAPSPVATQPPSASPEPSSPETGSPGGGSPDPSSTSTAPGPSSSGKVDAATASWLSATNAYCRGTTDPALKKVSPLSDTDPATYLTRVAAINRQLDTLLRKNPPSGLRAQVEQVASDWDRMATLFDQAAEAVRRNDRTGAGQLVAQADVANRRGNDLATRIGLRDCAQAGAIGVTTTPTVPGPTV